MAWTGPHEDLLRKLAGEGLSGSQIAARLGKTRSAVCGKAWRFGLCLGGMPAAGGTTVVRVRRKRAAAKHKRRKPKSNGTILHSPITGFVERIRPDSFVPPVDLPAPAHQRKTIATLEEASCRWPIGEPGRDGFHFCGAEAVPGKPYCSAHNSRAYVTPPVRKPRKIITPVPAFETEDA